MNSIHYSYNFNLNQRSNFEKLYHVVVYVQIEYRNCLIITINVFDYYSSYINVKDFELDVVQENVFVVDTIYYSANSWNYILTPLSYLPLLISSRSGTFIITFKFLFSSSFVANTKYATITKNTSFFLVLIASKKTTVIFVSSVSIKSFTATTLIILKSRSHILRTIKSLRTSLWRKLQ